MDSELIDNQCRKRKRRDSESLCESTETKICDNQIDSSWSFMKCETLEDDIKLANIKIDQSSGK